MLSVAPVILIGASTSIVDVPSKESIESVLNRVLAIRVSALNVPSRNAFPCVTSVLPTEAVSVSFLNRSTSSFVLSNQFGKSV